jgi:hypothetical protein
VKLSLSSLKPSLKRLGFLLGKEATKLPKLKGNVKGNGNSPHGFTRTSGIARMMSGGFLRLRASRPHRGQNEQCGLAISSNFSMYP